MSQFHSTNTRAMSGIARSARSLFSALSLVVVSTGLAYADPGNSAGAPVSRREYEALKRDLQQVTSRVATLKDAQSGSTSKQNVSPGTSVSQEALETSTFGRQVREQLDELKQSSESMFGGTSNFLIVGSAQASLEIPQHDSSSFGASFSPVFLWTLSPNFFVESELEVELEDSETVTKLEYAQMLYNVNDYLTVGAGKFLDPMNIFVERYEPSWINKLPDAPIGIYDGFLPESIVGAQARGAIPFCKDWKVLYSLFTGNGGNLSTDSADGVGSINFDNFTDNNRGKAVGGRVGLLAFSRFELGYGFEYATVGSRGTDFRDVGSYVQSADLDYNVEDDAIGGRFNLRGQYAWSHVDSTTYDPDGSLGFGPLAFSNRKSGGYAQASYRPTKSSMKALRQFELVFRYDRLDMPSGLPGSVDEQRATVGIDYWLRANTVLKAAYQFDDQKGADNNNKVLLQLATGLF